MDNKSDLNNQIIDQDDKKIIERLSKERGLSSDKLFNMVEEELAHQGMARRVGIISKLHNLIRQNKK